MAKLLYMAIALTLALPVVAPAQPANRFSDQLRALDLAQRNGVLRRAITENGMRCGRLDTSSYRGAFKRLAMWQARCTPGGDYAIFIGLDQSVQVRRCEDAKELGLPRCTLPPPAKRQR